MNSPKIRIGGWFKTINGDNLKVVAFNADEGTVKVQFYDGTIEEYDLEDWEALEVKPIAPPEDWSGSYKLSWDNYGVDLGHPAGETIPNPLDQLEDTE
ncbi:MAG: hypothetical protein KZQ66_20115 [Candidatus Thiodiazotropha sp. (ex Lucinoma aequizonata)]|nr:hypothetical protein [Candidatus Thiodiazotropha sp. (ex Lucinoma aequizonata)]MCU7889461.1 hypothetical protein [Candidatus Thiodiazotropha sp. (ex Lucinoma aequizonata)]MCU7896064.1 hypothetical protein [Candidatus Thiodiazotropha sp. (ex Lucinoma aequizonata)]MCU7899988.1 hypothetical protein [Candidatus Thiodiazotropha sp. (ex Lucinoma aequizonata)]MCU7903998.1 hypothetical protein [Candidatus Thiodiazotropha sp. (ex Lucinoma aequizonata)]